MSIEALIDDNLATLEEADALLGFLDPAHYSRVGPHLRHIVDHYNCLAHGVTQGLIDYDARERCRQTELSVARARQVLQAIRQALAELRRHPDVALTVRLATDPGGVSIESRSSLARELQFVQGHAVHHFALVRAVLDAIGVHLPESFGKAPATLRHERASA
ncbi:MAG: hypothetical protein VX549_01320 [Pseudomonadota bacterium]|nr:hypothetical protein [Pseudomonadota bacterium]